VASLAVELAKFYGRQGIANYQEYHVKNLGLLRLEGVP
jgi:hypothetical protein